jgi:uncharacterized membrane protein YedE/YeeE
MTLAVLFWVLMIIWLVFGLWTGYTPGQPYPVRSWGGNLLIFVLLAILGYAAFGGPVK